MQKKIIISDHLPRRPRRPATALPTPSTAMENAYKFYKKSHIQNFSVVQLVQVTLHSYEVSKVILGKAWHLYESVPHFRQAIIALIMYVLKGSVVYLGPGSVHYSGHEESWNWSSASPKGPALFNMPHSNRYNILLISIFCKIIWSISIVFQKKWWYFIKKNIKNPKWKIHFFTQNF